MSKIVVTSGQKYSDIDVYACGIAYAELLALEGKDAVVVLPGPINHSVTKSAQGFGSFVATSWQGDAEFVLVDVSQPEYLAGFVDQIKVLEVFDHHYGFEQHWQDRLGEKSHIEIVGACATLIWEEFVKRGVEDKISPASSNLLALAIVSNSLNFNASVTRGRDRKALKDLESHITLPNNWIAEYFTEQEAYIFQNLQTAITGDTKVQEIKNLDQTFVIGQIELWDSKAFIENYQAEIEQALLSYGSSNWFMTSPSISEGKNYLLTKSDSIKHLLTQAMGAKFTGNVGETARLWMRKEILAELYKISS